MSFAYRAIVLVAVAAIGFALGLLGGRFGASQRVPAVPASSDRTAAPVQPVEESLLIPLDLLNSPVLSVWSARVTGEVIVKTGSSLTLAPVTIVYDPQGTRISRIPDAPTLEIQYVAGETSFRRAPTTYEAHDVTASGAPPPPITEVAFEDLAFGSVVRGPVRLLRANATWQALGGTFYLQQ